MGSQKDKLAEGRRAKDHILNPARFVWISLTRRLDVYAGWTIPAQTLNVA